MRAFIVRSLAVTTVLAVFARAVYYLYPAREIEIPSSHVIYKDIDQVASRAELIILGQSLQSINEAEPRFTYHAGGRVEDFYSIYKVKSLRVLKGDTDSDTISVLQGAALLSSPYKAAKDLVILEGVTPMEKGNKYLLFLTETRQPGMYSVISLNQGKFSIDGLDQKEVAEESRNPQFKGLKAEALQKFPSILGK